MFTKQVKIVLKTTGLLLVVYLLLRIYFYQLYFSDARLSAQQLWLAFYWGARIDFTTITLLNILLWIYFLFIYQITAERWKRTIAIGLFVALNFPLLALCFIDLAYYRFNLRRSNVDLLSVFSDTHQSWGYFLLHYWYLFLLYFFVIAICLRLFLRILGSTKQADKGVSQKSKWQGLVCLLLFVILIKGNGLSILLPSASLLYLPPQQEALATNSSMSFLYSIAKKQTALKDKNYFTSHQLDSLFTIRRQYPHTDSFSKKNVVLFILESFSGEFLDRASSRKAQTPFLDSLMNESIVCSNAYSNGLESNKGIVGILASIPPVLDEPYFYSAYNSNGFRGLGSILKEQGYNTNFFMGAGKDHFGFGKLCNIVGIDNYYSGDDYHQAEHNDGHWGIYDHYFLPYAASVISKKKATFF